MFISSSGDKFTQPRSQGSLLPALSRSVGRVGENPGNEVEIHAFVAKLGNRCFCWFLPAMLVPIQVGTSMASLY